MESACPSAEKRKYYTVESANKCLPLVRVIIRDILRQWSVVSDLERQLAPIVSNQRKSGAHELYQEEIVQRLSELSREQEALRGYLSELEQLGVELKSVENGLCDFPALLGDREICLCWKDGEPAVEFWHELESGFAGRCPVETIGKLSRVAAK
jgi:hypothetical protein